MPDILVILAKEKEKEAEIRNIMKEWITWRFNIWIIQQLLDSY